jgi:hypothetical protein
MSVAAIPSSKRVKTTVPGCPASSMVGGAYATARSGGLRKACHKYRGRDPGCLCSLPYWTPRSCLFPPRYRPIHGFLRPGNGIQFRKEPSAFGAVHRDRSPTDGRPSVVSSLLPSTSWVRVCSVSEAGPPIQEHASSPLLTRRAQKAVSIY